jgi:antitoxin (DNA-binding transcriptional repressor) of toxin-antitoxin stability system
MKVTIVEAAARLPELIAAAQAGEEVIIANDHGLGVRLALVESSPSTSHPTGSWAAIEAALNTLPKRAQRSAEEIDAEIREIRDGWD